MPLRSAPGKTSSRQLSRNSLREFIEARLSTYMKLAQGQIWKKGAAYYRITKWARLAIEYKRTRSLTSGADGVIHKVTKKEFCRLIKGAELIDLEGDGALQSDSNVPLPKRDSL